jgi:uncharacterized protein
MPIPAHAPHLDQLLAEARSRPGFMAQLRAVRSLGLASWCIGAGAVRNMVWDALHHKTTPSALADVDVAYFDASAQRPEQDAELQAQLAVLLPGVPWEVTNQANVHQWFEGCFGHAVAPLRSLEDAVGSWPEFATCVGLSLDDEDRLTVIAPHGLEDLMGCVVRRNPRRVSVATYRERVVGKRYAERWPGVTVVTC